MIVQASTGQLYDLKDRGRLLIVESLRYYREVLDKKVGETRNSAYKKDYALRAMDCTSIANILDGEEF